MKFLVREQKKNNVILVKLPKRNLPPHQKHLSKEKARGPGVQISVVGLLFSASTNNSLLL